MTNSIKERAERDLGFDLPPTRLDYENFRTDFRIGVLGLHWVMLNLHLPAYAAARFNVSAACEINPERIAETRKKSFKVGPILGDWHELLKRDDVDLIDCTFGHSYDKVQKRIEVIEAALSAGKHIMTHKPIAQSMQQAEVIARLAREGAARGLRVAVNQNCRYSPAHYSIKGLLTPQRLGRPNVIEVQQYWRGDAKPFDRTGAWVQHAIHHADTIRWWVGQPCVSVTAKSAVRATAAIYEFADGTIAYHMENHIGCENHENNIRITAEKGVIRAGHNWNWHLPSSSPYDFVEVFRDTRLPGIRLPLPDQVSEPHWSGVNKWIPVPGAYYDLGAPLAGMMGTMGALMRGIAENREPDNNVPGAMESFRMCLAAEISSETGKPVDPRQIPLDAASRR